MSGYENVRQKLFEMADAKYRAFSEKLNPGIDKIIGVRVPIIKKLAKEISQSDWRGFLGTADGDYFEEIMLQGLVIGFIRADIEEAIFYIEKFVPKIQSWAVCDSFCSGLKIVKKNRQRVWDFIKAYLFSEKEFEVRFAVIIIIDFFIDKYHLADVFEIFESIGHDGYYVKMAVAWALSLCFIRFPEETAAYLKRSTIDDFTCNKALQKIIESNRVSDEVKAAVRLMMRK